MAACNYLPLAVNIQANSCFSIILKQWDDIKKKDDLTHLFWLARIKIFLGKSHMCVALRWTEKDIQSFSSQSKNALYPFIV